MTAQHSGPLVLVAGGSGDIGATVCADLLVSGARVRSADLRPAPPGLGAPEFRGDLVDLTSPDAVESWITSIVRRDGPIDAAVVSVGVVRSARLVDLTLEEWREDVASLLDSAFVVGTSVIRAMTRRPGSGMRRLVFVGSWAAEVPHPHIGAYGVAKAGLRALVRTLALDHAPDGVLVNEVAPGIVDAGLSRRVLRDDPDLAARTERRLPLGRLVTSEAVSREVLHLIDGSNTSTTGSVVTIDGGISLTSLLSQTDG